MDGAGIAFFLMAVTFVVGLAIMAAQNEGKAKQLREAEAAYRSGLAALKLSPTDADLQDSTLQRGRIYSNLTRNNKGVTMYDEVALMNDINAVCAGAGVPQVPRDSGRKPIEERLANLLQLKERDLITAQEYEQRRAEIIKEL
jgi:hypothetical protein